MLKNNLNEEVLLRQFSASGQFENVLKILNKNKRKSTFNINAQSSNGNTALHWACCKAIEKEKGYTSDYSKIIRLLIEHKADYLIKNKCGKIPYDFLKHMPLDEHRGQTKRSGILNENVSCYFALINSLLKIECMKTMFSSEFESALSLTTFFHVILDSLELFRFFPDESKEQETFLILSLACGVSTEVLPLIIYFQYQGKKIHYVGIDNNSAVIQDNRLRYANFENVEFICADASNLNEITNKIPLYSIDLAILRNADFTEYQKRQSIFCKIVDQVIPHFMKPNSPLWISFQTEYELNFCKTKTKICQNFKKFHANNLCDTGEMCNFFTQHKNRTVVNHPDRFSIILNSERTTPEETLACSLKK
ncbi:hypothetical protein [Rickettsiella grylli]|uniref:C3H1-type domain-containing protein n=1 Tax=Rickettsiella grylli TaxID=59196 RepID=A8PMX2_9COXI|nr:hypothetical protein [Rickettsiella grylli]EDP46070.1 hypothetical protein RICGR_0851 [Rickettsiella grylli]